MTFKARYERFWFGLEVSEAKLAAFRLLFFGVLAVDAWLQIEHAPRYGAGDFNVAQFGFVDAILGTPSRVGMLAVYVTQAVLAARLALGAAGRGTAIALAVLFGYSYFISQLNSYQHHYLVFLLVGCACFLPTGPPAKGDRTPTWPIRLILVQISILYVWASIAKLEPLWLDGTTFRTQLAHAGTRQLIEDTIGWAGAAKLTIALELFLAVAIHIRVARVVALVLGAAFHITIQAVGFKIGLFSYFMLALYSLLVPDIAWTEVAKALAAVRDRAAEVAARIDKHRAAAAGAVVAAIAAGLAMVWTLPFEDIAAGAVITAVAAAATYGASLRAGAKAVAASRIAAGHLAACALVLALSATTDTARDYHRFWGGSLRRLGDLEAATRVYEQAVAIAPDYAPGHTSLGNLYRRRGNPARALVQYHRALELAPDDWRPNLGAAMAYDAQGNGDAAVAAARKVLAARPGNSSARSILQKWADSGGGNR